ncbi:hypothetical protein FDG2_4371 [Candidatus Protofrankia californiensis]|uniref:Uncharacterized protein n=1 Tax=Candidatus Protofrankia californiensis TaxID=1839754 RepID=A0A1C3P5D5_9ACTN|nr:hypothetical protein FDG2_4371 [Candidatus Protofrankia californiensis]
MTVGHDSSSCRALATTVAQIPSGHQPPGLLAQPGRQPRPRRHRRQRLGERLPSNLAYTDSTGRRTVDVFTSTVFGMGAPKAGAANQTLVNAAICTMAPQAGARRQRHVERAPPRPAAPGRQQDHEVAATQV